MYITGTVSDFASRLHQLPCLNQETGTIIESGLADMANFILEGQQYLASGLADMNISGKWEQSARTQRWLLSGDAAQMFQQQF